MRRYDIVSIGDTTIDAFLELHEASVHCALDHSNCQLCFTFADKIPYDRLTMLPAGNSTNNAVGSSRLGLKTAFVSAVGNDEHGRMIITELKKEKIDTKFININQKAQTNFHVVLSFQGERTILIKHNKFEYNLPAKLDTDWVYFSSMASGTESFHKQLSQVLHKQPKVKLAFNPGTFQLRMDSTKLRDLYKRTEVVFVNREEAELILKVQTKSIQTLLKGLHKLGARYVVITDGRDGSYASNGSGPIWYIEEFGGPKIESTGAGDAYATAFTAALYYGKPISEAMIWGTINAGHVVQFVGPHAGLQTKTQIETHIRKHPNFKAHQISNI
jgi:5-dehydro-2-deoxygluconokinase